MGKILIIGVGDAGTNIVKHMKDHGIQNANYITMGDYRGGVPDIPHFNLIELSEIYCLPAGASAEKWKDCAERAKDIISEIIGYYTSNKQLEE